MSRVEDVQARYEAEFAAAARADERKARRRAEMEAWSRGWLFPLLPPLPPPVPEPLAWITDPCGSKVVHPSGLCPTCRQQLLPEIPNPMDDPPGWRPAPPHERRIPIYAIVDPEPSDDGGWLGTIVNACTLPIDPPWPCSGGHA